MMRSLARIALLLVPICFTAACAKEPTAAPVELVPPTTPVTVPNYSLLVEDGDAQFGEIGRPLERSLTVLVRDWEGASASGIAVTFRVRSGGGIMRDSVVTSREDGRAYGQLTLGSDTGSHTIVARAPSGDSVRFTARALPTSPEVRMSLLAPSPGFVGDTITVWTTVTSTRQLASVVARIGGVVVPLQVGSTPGRWEGTIAIGHLPRDTVSLFVRATDQAGAFTERALTLKHDRRPTLSISAPRYLDLVRPGVRLTATCADDDAATCMISVLRQGVRLAGPVAGTLDQEVDLRLSDGSAVDLLFEVRDSGGQRVTEVRTVYVESSSRLHHVATLGERMLDMLGSRIATQRGSYVVVRDTVTGVEDSTKFEGTLVQGRLIPSGVVLQVEPAAPSSDVLIVSRRSQSPIVKNVSGSFVAAGPYVIFLTGFSPYALWRLDTETGTEVLLASSVGNIHNDVASNGNVAYWSFSNSDPKSDIYLFRAGAATLISFSDSTARRNTSPRTDGEIVVFTRNPPPFTSGSYDIQLYDGSGLVTLASHTLYANPGYDYGVNNGWVGFTRSDPSGFRQVWTRSSTGLLRQISAFGSSASIRGVGADGSVLLEHSRSLYFGSATSSLVRVSATFNDVRWRDGRFVLFTGPSVFAIVP